MKVLIDTNIILDALMRRGDMRYTIPDNQGRRTI
jgi:predicted nucleic acid-binding protein